MLLKQATMTELLGAWAALAEATAELTEGEKTSRATSAPPRSLCAATAVMPSRCLALMPDARNLFFTAMSSRWFLLLFQRPVADRATDEDGWHPQSPVELRG
jgi:hypothetical protein